MIQKRSVNSQAWCRNRTEAYPGMRTNQSKLTVFFRAQKQMFVYNFISNQLAAWLMTLPEMQMTLRPPFVVFANKEQTKRFSYLVWGYTARALILAGTFASTYTQPAPLTPQPYSCSMGYILLPCGLISLLHWPVQAAEAHITVLHQCLPSSQR